MWLYMFVKTNFPLYYSTLYDYIRLYPSSPHSIAIKSPKKYVGPGAAHPWTIWIFLQGTLGAP